MPKYIEYDLGDGLTVLVEAAEAETGGVVRAASRAGESTIERAQKTFREALVGAKAQAKILIEEIEELHVSEAEIHFGLSVEGELGNIAVGKVGMGVNYDVTLKWKKQ